MQATIRDSCHGSKAGSHQSLKHETLKGSCKRRGRDSIPRTLGNANLIQLTDIDDLILLVLVPLVETATGLCTAQ